MRESEDIITGWHACIDSMMHSHDVAPNSTDGKKMPVQVSSAAKPLVNASPKGDFGVQHTASANLPGASVVKGVWSVAHTTASSGYSAPQYEHFFIECLCSHSAV